MLPAEARRSILMNTWGSLGDLHPYIAVALGLRQRGHSVTIATSEIYRAKIEDEGIRFAPVRPDLGEMLQDREAIRRAHDPRTGSEYVVRSLVLPFLDLAYQDLLAAAQGADLLVGHPLAFAIPVIAEKLRIPWISIALSPMSFLSTFDPPVFGPAPWMRPTRRLGPWPHALFYRFIRIASRSWFQPLHALRRKAGLPPSTAHPFMEGAFSPHGTLAWFSRHFAEPQPDWPPHTEVTGFPFYDRGGWDIKTDPALHTFLPAGEPPVVFTLGSAAVWEAGEFYNHSLEAVSKLGIRAVLLVGFDPRNRPAGDLPDSVFVTEYAPYSELFSRAAAIVHQGGVGTTAQALRAGRPSLVVPFSHDQPDNAVRASRFGVARVIPKRAYTAESAAGGLRRLLNDTGYSSRAAELSSRIRIENGVECACDALERIAAKTVRL